VAAAKASAAIARCACIGALAHLRGPVFEGEVFISQAFMHLEHDPEVAEFSDKIMRRSK
jgi:hypothetical protein